MTKRKGIPKLTLERAKQIADRDAANSTMGIDYVVMRCQNRYIVMSAISAALNSGTVVYVAKHGASANRDVNV